MKFKIIGFIFLILLLLPPPILALRIPARDVIGTDRSGVEKNLQEILNRILPIATHVDLSNLTATGSQLNELVGGGNTTLHSHAGGVGNADTLDSLDSTQFLRSDTNATFSGSTLTIDGDVSLTSGGTISSTSNGNIAIEPNGTGVLTIGTAADETIMQLRGTLSVTGDIFTPALVELEMKTHELDTAVKNLQMAIQSQENLFQEFNDTVVFSNQAFQPYVFERGESHLTSGEAFVTLSPQFLEKVEIDRENPLFVKTTLLSDKCSELAVVERNDKPPNFRVKELYNGGSDCPFLWEASARKKRR